MPQKPLKNGCNNSGHNYDEATLNMLEERQAEYIKGNIAGLTVAESMEPVKQELQKRRFTISI